PQQMDPPIAEPASSLVFAGLDDPPIQLGALERSGLLALAALDDDARSGSAAAASFAAAAASSSSFADPFAPPGGELDDVLVDLADDEHERRTTPRSAVNDEVTVRRVAPAVNPEVTTRRLAPSADAGSAGSGLALEVTPRMAA